MFEHFNDLNQEESKLTVDAIAYITLLIAGADGVIDSKEKAWATKLTKIRSYNLPDSLKSFYSLVGEDFAETTENLINSLPDDSTERNSLISIELTKLSEILPKMNRNFSIQLAESYRSFAKHVAESSGGFLGFGSISSGEKKLIGLSMINYPK